MSAKVVDAVVEACKDIGWYLWREDVRTLYGRRRIAKTDRWKDVAIAPSDREGDFLDYHFTVNPYSLIRRTPQQKLEALTATMERIVPLLQPGMPINPEKLLQIYAKGLDLPELMEVFGAVEPPQDTPQQRQSPVTTRKYERTSRPGASREGSAQTAMAMANGKGVQDSMRDAQYRR